MTASTRDLASYLLDYSEERRNSTHNSPEWCYANGAAGAYRHVLEMMGYHDDDIEDLLRDARHRRAESALEN